MSADAKPILRAYRGVMNRTDLSPSETKNLEEIVMEMGAFGFTLQAKGGMPCEEVKRLLDKRINQINNLK